MPEVALPVLTPRPKAIRDKCIDCSGGSLAEAKRCQITRCPLWIHGPAGVIARKASLSGSEKPSRIKRTLTPEHLEAMRRGREAKKKIS